MIAHYIFSVIYKHSPWANGLLRYADAGLVWDLNVRLIKIRVTTGIHDNYCNCLVLHHVEKLLSCDSTCWDWSYQTIKTTRNEKTKNVFMLHCPLGTNKVF